MPGFKVAHLGQPDVLQIHMKSVGGLIKWFKKDQPTVNPKSKTPPLWTWVFVINHPMESLGQDNCTLCTPFQSHKSGKIHFFILRASNWNFSKWWKPALRNAFKSRFWQRVFKSTWTQGEMCCMNLKFLLLTTTEVLADSRTKGSK